MNTVKGDLLKLALDGQFDAIIHGCNCYCTMGAGIAKAIKSIFPEAYDADCKTDKGDKSKLGSYTSATITKRGHELTIINAYTQYHYKGSGVKADYEAIQNRLGIPVSFSGYPWKRAQHYIRTGKHDGMLTTPTEARAEYGVFGKEPTLDSSYFIITLKDSPHIERFKKVQKLEDLKPFLRVDFSGNGWTQKNMKEGYRIHFVTRTDQIWKVLVRGRADTKM